MLKMAPIATIIKITSLNISSMSNAPFKYLIVLYRNLRSDQFVGIRFKVILNKLIFYTKVRLRKKTAYVVIVYLVEADVDQIKQGYYKCGKYIINIYALFMYIYNLNNKTCLS